MKQINRWKLIWLLFINPRTKYGNKHNDWFSGLLNYAITNYDNKRGEYADKVLMYTNTYDIMKGVK